MAKPKSRAVQWFVSKAFRKEALVFWTLLGVGVGIALGAGLYGVKPSPLAIELIGYPGELLIRALQLLVLPLIVLALMSGVLALRHSTAGTGRITGYSLSYYLMSMFVAIAIGIGLVYAIKPGAGEPFNNANQSCSTKGSAVIATATGANGGTATADSGTVASLLNIGRQLVPKNIVNAAANDQYLGVICFSIVFAIAINIVGPRAEPLANIIEIANDIIIMMIFWVIWFTPIGVASLIAKTILNACDIVALIKSLGLYLATVLAGFGIHGFIALPLTLFLLGRVNPLRSFKSFTPAFAMAFGTASSAATMPMTMACGIKHGIEESIVKFVIPLGTNVNRDGAALYEAVSVLFLAQANGFPLSAGQVIIIALTATLAAIGSASIPNSALVSMVTVLNAVGMSEYIPQLAILFSVDWLIGMFRTVLNVWGDACAAVVVDQWVLWYNKKQVNTETKDVEANTIPDMPAVKAGDGPTA